MQKKSRFQKAKDEVEARRASEEAEMAQALNSFQEAFDGPLAAEEGQQVFVNSSISGGSSVYRPSAKKGSEMEKMFLEMKSRSRSCETSNNKLANEAPSSSSSNSGSKPQREIDRMVEEMKSSGPSALAAATPGGHSHSNVHVDPDELATTTNLYVGNIHPAVGEGELNDLFRRFGDVQSVKVMWPRTAEEHARRRNCGFVCFYDRCDAEEALARLDGYALQGQRITLAWSKVHKSSGMDAAAGSASSSHHHHHHPATGEGEALFASEVEYTGAPGQVLLEVEVPADPQQAAVIDQVARSVSVEGDSLEEAIMEREAGKDLFRFLREGDGDSGASLYYRWRTYAFVMGDTLRNWRTRPFQISAGGPFYLPPPLPSQQVEGMRKRRREGGGHSRSPSPEFSDRGSRFRGMTGAQIAREKARDRVRGGGVDRLSAEARLAFSSLLSSLTIANESIRRGTGFAYDHAYAHADVAQILRESLLHSPHAPAALRVARLYLASDILFNCGQAIRSSTHYLLSIQAFLPEVFLDLGALLRSGSLGRMSAKQLEDRCRALLGVWSEWSLFTDTYLAGLEAQLLMSDRELQRLLSCIQEDEAAAGASAGGGAEYENAVRRARSFGVPVAPSSTLYDLVRRTEHNERFHATTRGGVTRQRHITAAADDVDGAPIDDVDGAPIDDVDGAPIDDVDGAPIDDVDGAPIDDVDGAPIDDVDGAPIDDVDGAPSSGTDRSCAL